MAGRTGERQDATLTLKIKVALRRQGAQTLTWQASNGQPASQQTIAWGPGP